MTLTLNAYHVATNNWSTGARDLRTRRKRYSTTTTKTMVETNGSDAHELILRYLERLEGSQRTSKSIANNLKLTRKRVRAILFSLASSGALHMRFRCPGNSRRRRPVFRCVSAPIDEHHHVIDMSCSDTLDLDLDLDLEAVKCVASNGVASDSVALNGVASDGVASDGVESDGVASEGVESDSVESENVASEGVASDEASEDAWCVVDQVQ